ncbi:MAG: A/G-specific adenine glycosylase [Elusimicrobia bacterium]|nr:A/G-specific adenine glycosylase [Elusimicrobiota bacterium]
MDLGSLRTSLLQWYGERGRDLPWRRTKDPYRVWLSEVMLQQTTVAAVMPRFERFLETYPTVRALAKARRSSVLASWSGLGYYRRAASLHEAAGLIVRDHGGVFPADPGARLPGVGDYTRAAVLSIAYGMPLAVVDTNVSRVLSRLCALKGEASGNADRLKALAQVLLPTGKAGDWNQALMDLGAMVCLPRGPRCGECPWSRQCEARKAGLQDRIPGLPARQRPVPVRLDCVLCERQGMVLVEKRAAGLLAGHWGLPGSKAGRVLATVRQRITRHSVTLVLRRAAAPPRPPGGGLRWVRKADLARYLVSSLWRKALESAGC